jgi:hypothetical protein
MEKRSFRVALEIKRICWNGQIDPLWRDNLRNYILSWRKKKRVPELEHEILTDVFDCYHLKYEVPNKQSLIG